MTAAVRAAIKRATVAAQRQVAVLDEDSRQSLTALYRQAADEIGSAILARTGADDNLALAQLQDLLAQVQSRLQALASARGGLLDDVLAEASRLGTAPYRETLGSAAAMEIPDQAVRFVRGFVAADGLQLSDRIWRVDRGARDAVVNAIESAVIQGHGAGQAAREFLARGDPVPADVRDKIDAANGPRLARTTRTQLLTGTGNPLDNAMRLFRTEINRAHGEAYMMGGAQTPGFAGWRFLLSPAHPKPDICDLLSRQNLHGLGPGVYPNREKLPWPAHPNTLSFVEIVFADEITGADRAGRETPVEALNRLTPAQREGVLGQGKARLHADGALRQGMIRAPLKAVRRRLERASRPT